MTRRPRKPRKPSWVLYDGDRLIASTWAETEEQARATFAKFGLRGNRVARRANNTPNHNDHNDPNPTSRGGNR